MQKGKMDVRSLCFIGIFVAFLTMMAQISFPLPVGVPFTMQTFAVSMAGILLGSRRGSWAVLAYVLLGAVGVPVFAQFTGGPHILIGPTGGFLFSFPAMAWLIGRGAERKDHKGALAWGLAAGTALNYACGVLFFALQTGSGLWASFLACAAPFLPAEVVKAVLAGVLGPRVKTRAGRVLPSE